ncbi:MAG: hypothetical protein A2845_03825 [Candidatus Lloydbacteria bacterium RIFCSPHIGHO2_01_FULL_49_22]|uniref:Uncharacterized protein n=1 Tax=Candidatus Lloydbacteria bacterium RIFCSPHIGHO2_01_FULL_49_22 TaxID=1798658 RepID=A0A1G2CXE6_9BACT|nr:MAG: hypothetical protein A2845_03825 [Candidatus Lloydbacteria bacterium RIFCSPHIGHO2_01_FULL_49_22]OGZ09055.1 MAG: hypothetical protein A3C14_03660 [Candidatus Lloydbacteria bacterium RIFCSPHIGHO2_02_FULL_50_18]
MTDDKKPALSAVSGDQSFDDIQSRLALSIMGKIAEFGFAHDREGRPNPKMAMSLVRAVADAVELRYRDETREYVSTRFDEQVERYIALGLHDAAGYTEDSFRTSLRPLAESVKKFFDYPSNHPIRDGEYTLLLVLPERMVPVRRLLATFLGSNIFSVFDTLRMDVRSHGKVAPDSPYVLVGINGGRGLLDHSIARADDWMEKNGRTYLSLHQAVQLFLMRPHFLSAQSDALHAQSEALVLGEKCSQGLIKFVARSSGNEVLFVDEKNIHGEVGVGKPHYTTMISV